MEEVSAHVHLGPIVPDVLTKQHKHRSGLIWSGTMRRVSLNFNVDVSVPIYSSLTDSSTYTVKEERLEAWILREFTSLETDDNLILRARAIWFMCATRHGHVGGSDNSQLMTLDMAIDCKRCIWTLFHWSGAESLDIANESNDITYRTGKKNIEISRYGSKSLDMNNDNEMRYLWTIAPDLAKGFIYLLNSFKSNNRP
ncbi:hypothetical protein M9H77_14321 [Catharanthus roseus]|uniref:Uncharacterized protein n=1 Tax=Catharanthus roseus TaxID=4058 RepID=A0ACC0BMQ0_CATRO|nr:hypothetical protein M9H77_14321 [Catharanthus roseus]